MHTTPAAFAICIKEKKFRIRSLTEILADLTEVSHNPYAPYIDKVFLADGDALVMKTEDLLVILDAIHHQAGHIISNQNPISVIAERLTDPQRQRQGRAEKNRKNQINHIHL